MDREFSWLELYAIVWNSLPEIMVQRTEMPENPVAWVAGSTLRLNAEADGLVAHFIEHGRWPRVDGDVRIMLFLRSLFAAELLHSRASRAYPGPAQQTGMTHLRSSLESTWYHEWPAWVLLRFGGRWELPHEPWPEK